MGQTLPPSLYAAGSLHALAASGAGANKTFVVNAANTAWEWRAVPGLDTANSFSARQTLSAGAAFGANQTVYIPVTATVFDPALPGDYFGWRMIASNTDRALSITHGLAGASDATQPVVTSRFRALVDDATYNATYGTDTGFTEHVEEVHLPDEDDPARVFYWRHIYDLRNPTPEQGFHTYDTEVGALGTFVVREPGTDFVMCRIGNTSNDDARAYFTFSCKESGKGALVGGRLGTVMIGSQADYGDRVPLLVVRLAASTSPYMAAFGDLLGNNDSLWGGFTDSGEVLCAVKQAAPTDGEIANGQFIAWVDRADVASAVLKFRHRALDGTLRTIEVSESISFASGVTTISGTVNMPLDLTSGSLSTGNATFSGTINASAFAPGSTLPQHTWGDVAVLSAGASETAGPFVSGIYKGSAGQCSLNLVAATSTTTVIGLGNNGEAFRRTRLTPTGIHFGDGTVATSVMLGWSAAGVAKVGTTATSASGQLDMRAANSTVAALPAPAAGTKGRLAFATNGRKFGEVPTAGTGTLCYDDGTAWRRVSDDSTVAA